MIISYRPDDGPAVQFDFLPGSLVSSDSEAVESVGGSAWGTYEEWGALFFRGSQRARRAALWLMLRKTNPRLKFDDVSFRADQVSVDYSVPERQIILETMLADPNLDEAQRANLVEIVGSGLVADAEAAMKDMGLDREPDLDGRPATSGAGDSTSLTPDSLPASVSLTGGP